MSVSLSVLTICRNDRNGLAATIASVVGQTRRPDEFIVLDGASSDGTVEFLASAEGPTYWRSESDEGIADAFNKVAALATSDWILFLNAGDTFVDAQVLAEATDRLVSLGSEVGVCYGDCLTVDPTGLEPTRRIQGRHTFDTRDCPICHQAAFIRRSLQLQTPYDPRLRLGMDYDLWHRLARKTEFARIDRMICLYRLGGISSSREWGEHNIIAHHMVDWMNSRHRQLGLPDVAALFSAVVGYRVKKWFEQALGPRTYSKLKRHFKMEGR